ncbi:alpha/beta-hydrolase [Coprinellus micaceus]|uniref:Alpha/beta-hydrolase n=1 Tax=Coprinellus micaceus TaxID=71717 RepID=A0A4Y7SXU6_COPMI|nr:alpha/beta-hydrolase [Coprinellus micaceus]
MVSFTLRVVQFLSVVALLPSLVHSVPADQSPVLAGGLGPDCFSGTKHDGKPSGKNITIAGVPTYLSEPKKGTVNVKAPKVLLFYSDVFSAFFVNNQLLQDYFATQGYYVLGPDYFFGDPIQKHTTLDLEPLDPNFDLPAWLTKSRAQAAAALPAWVDAVKKRYGPKAQYTASGYCFGAKYSVEQAATDQIVAGAFAHPGDLTEAHFRALTKPLLLTCAEVDSTFPAESLYRAVDVLTEEKKKYHVQIYSGTVHGFTTRANLSDENSVWSAEEAAKSTIGWFDRFTN